MNLNNCPQRYVTGRRCLLLLLMLLRYRKIDVFSLVGFGKEKPQVETSGRAKMCRNRRSQLKESNRNDTFDGRFNEGNQISILTFRREPV